MGWDFCLKGVLNFNPINLKSKVKFVKNRLESPNSNLLKICEIFYGKRNEKFVAIDVKTRKLFEYRRSWMFNY
jgi:hypothetical protein